jgi:hypothetical protein
VGVIVGLDELIGGTESFKDIVESAVRVAKDTVLSDGDVQPCLVIIKDTKAYIIPVPDGHQEMASFFVDMVEKYKGCRGYIFITESWALHVSTEDFKEVSKYLQNPDSIALNPFKEERLTFHAATHDESFEGYVEMTRDDDGNLVLGNTVYEVVSEHFTNVADLLLPMVK